MSYNNMTAPGVGYLMTNGTDTTTIYNRRSYGSSTSFTDGGVAVTTAWTGSFTVAWRHPGGGSSSVKWQWWLYKIAGQ